ncbi:VOC family protein [Tropicibacter oceani]|uniref:VOC family protein n=1 Tax=Tropicibacter oceani TaxID=3058420 RepID=A0ABY8QN16_9RHOB|nr:VOC family protein [Tropicibacter oceani]WGW05408.1 VOC family protein [Tropicibacter oceani]
MPITAFDHVNVRTANLRAMVDWYGAILGLHPGPRPPFRMGGAWLYLADQPYIHLVEVGSTPQAGGDCTLEHFAFRATDMATFISRLTQAGIEHSIDPVPDFPIVQVNFRDPDGNHIHVDFHKDEMAGL